MPKVPSITGRDGHGCFVDNPAPPQCCRPLTIAITKECVTQEK